MRRKVWLVSGLVVLINLLGLVLSWLDPAIRAPSVRAGFHRWHADSAGRRCDDACAELKAIGFGCDPQPGAAPGGGPTSPQPGRSRVQLLDGGQSLLLRLPTLSAAQGQAVIEAVEPVAGPFLSGGQSVDTIGPSLGNNCCAAI